MDIFKQLRAFIWPNTNCAVCGKPQCRSLLCDDCQNLLNTLTVCPNCGSFTPNGHLSGHYCPHVANVNAVLTCFPYNSALKGRLRLLKYHNRPQIAADIAPLLLQRWQSFAANGYTADAIVPVPLHPARMAERGYNQSHLLAKALAAEVKLPVYANAVKRVKNTRPLHSLNPAERAANLQNAFAPGSDISKIKGKRIILLDDIITTGATVQHCAQILSEGGAVQVYALAAGGHLVK